MKILIISAYFPPLNSIASLRPYSWAKWWSHDGHQIAVLTTCKERDPTDLNFDLRQFEVLSVPVPIPMKAVARQAVSQASKGGWAFSPARLMAFAMVVLKKWYLGFIRQTGCFCTCRFPDWHDAWAAKAFKALGDGNWDLVVSSGGPYSVHRVAWALKRRGRARLWIVDWRDLWTKNHHFPGFAPFRPYERRLEHRFHEAADLITTVSEPLARNLRESTATRVEVVYNGFDAEDFSRVLSRPRLGYDRLTIAYTGSVYRGAQDVTPLFRAIRVLIDRGDLRPDGIQLLFAGKFADLSDIARQEGVQGQFHYLGSIPREQALELQYDADAVAFLEYQGTETGGVLTGKLFEYLFIARYILGIGATANSETGGLIEGYSAGRALGDDVEAICKAIVELRNLTAGCADRDRSALEFYSRSSQAKHLMKLALQAVDYTDTNDLVRVNRPGFSRDHSI